MLQQREKLAELEAKGLLGGEEVGGWGELRCWLVNESAVGMFFPFCLVFLLLCDPFFFLAC